MFFDPSEADLSRSAVERSAVLSSRSSLLTLKTEEFNAP
jgi:hypothetical protein